MRVLAIIPARYASTRFPGKPLALLGGKPVIEWVWERVSSVSGLDEAVVATDDNRIAQAVEAFGGRVVMTGSHHRSGTDRCGEVLQRMKEQGNIFDVAINVQAKRAKPFISAASPCPISAAPNPPNG